MTESAKSAKSPYLHLHPHLLQCHRDEYSKRLKSPLAWTREPNNNGHYYHIPFDAKGYLSRFSEEDAQAVSQGTQPRKYKQDKRFAALRRLLDKLSPEEVIQVLGKLQEEHQ